MYGRGISKLEFESCVSVSMNISIASKILRVKLFELFSIRLELFNLLSIRLKLFDLFSIRLQLFNDQYRFGRCERKYELRSSINLEQVDRLFPFL